MRSNPFFTPARISGWVASSVVVLMVLVLAGKLGSVLADGVQALAVLAGIISAGELLARMGGAANAPTPAGDAMRAVIEPYYATLRRTVPAQQDEAGAGELQQYEFDAATASVVADETDAYADAAGRPVYALKRYARSPEGEYFWLVLEVGPEGAPRLAYIKHVPHRVARYALKDRYVAPPG